MSDLLQRAKEAIEEWKYDEFPATGELLRDLAAALEAAQKDAERYEWLVENAVIECDKWRHDGRDPASTKQPLDNAIDAAIAERIGK